MQSRQARNDSCLAKPIIHRNKTDLSLKSNYSTIWQQREMYISNICTCHQNVSIEKIDIKQKQYEKERNSF